MHASAGKPHSERTPRHRHRDRDGARDKGGELVTTATQAPPASTPAGTRPGDNGDGQAGGPVPPATASTRRDQPAASSRARTSSPVRSPASTPRARTVRSWPLLFLALPAAITVWSGWVGIGQMTGFGLVHPLPGIWESLHLNTAVTLPVGVEAYAAYALRAWLSASAAVSARTRRFARRSAAGSLLLGMAGQIAYHLLDQAGVTRAPWPVTTAVSCLPVLVLGLGAALAHLLRADASDAKRPGTGQPGQKTDRPGRPSIQDPATAAKREDRMAEAETAAARLAKTGQRISRRTLRTAGLRGSNADLGALARDISTPPARRRITTDLA